MSGKCLGMVASTEYSDMCYAMAMVLSTRRAPGNECFPGAHGIPATPRQGFPSFPVFQKKPQGTTRTNVGAVFCLQLWSFVEPTLPKDCLPCFPTLPGSLLPLHQLFQPKRPLAAPASSPANPSSLSPALCTLGLQPAVGVGGESRRAKAHHRASGLCTEG